MKSVNCETECKEIQGISLSDFWIICIMVQKIHRLVCIYKQAWILALIRLLFLLPEALLSSTCYLSPVLTHLYIRHLSTTSTMAKTRELSKDTKHKIVDLHKPGMNQSTIGNSLVRRDQLLKQLEENGSLTISLDVGIHARSHLMGHTLYLWWWGNSLQLHWVNCSITRRELGPHWQRLLLVAHYIVLN